MEQRPNLEQMLEQYLAPGANNDEVASMSFEEEASTAGPSSSAASYEPSATASAASADIFYCAQYLDLDDILAQSNRVAVSFNRTIPKLGFLDAGAEDDTMRKGTKLELPLWLVKELNADQVVHVTIPKGYNHTYREILEADANCVNLNKLGPNFYRFGQHLSTMNLPESEDIANSMIDTYTQRFHRLVNFALSGSNVGRSASEANASSLSKTTTKSSTAGLKTSTSAGDDINTLPDLLNYANGLDNWEKSLLAIGQSAARQMKRWQNRDLVKVTANEMVTNLHKRKRLVEQHKQFQGMNGSSNNTSGRSSPVPGGGSNAGPQSAFK